MKTILAALILMSSFTSSIAQEMYTCTVDGKKAIQDRPCSLPKVGQSVRVQQEKNASQIQAEFDAEAAQKKDRDLQKLADEEKRAQTKKTIAAAQRECQEANKSAAVVSNSSLDGSVAPVKEYLDKTLREPSSFEAIRWGNVVRTCDGYTVAVTYRARNGFGGMAVASEIFLMDQSGYVVSVQR